MCGTWEIMVYAAAHYYKFLLFTFNEENKNIFATFSVGYFLNENFTHLHTLGNVIFEMFSRFLPNITITFCRQVDLFAKLVQVIGSFFFTEAFYMQVSLSISRFDNQSVTRQIKYRWQCSPLIKIHIKKLFISPWMTVIFTRSDAVLLLSSIAVTSKM